MSQSNVQRRGFIGACVAGVGACFGVKQSDAKDKGGPIEGEMRLVDEPDGLTCQPQQFLRGQWRDVPSVDRKAIDHA